MNKPDKDIIIFFKPENKPKVDGNYTVTDDKIGIGFIKNGYLGQLKKTYSLGKLKIAGPSKDVPLVSINSGGISYVMEGDRRFEKSFSKELEEIKEKPFIKGVLKEYCNKMPLIIYKKIAL